MNQNFKYLKVLAYHTIDDIINFEKQLCFLKNNYSIISIDDLNQFLAQKKQLPEKPLLITFDDGDLSIYINAFPLLKKYNLAATIFVVTDLIDTNKPFWWDEIEYHLGKVEGNKKVWEVKTWDNEKREKFLVRLRQESEKQKFTYQQLSTAQLQEMNNANINIANHSHTHPIFSKCTEHELHLEMENSIKVLNNNGFNSQVFAYPNGNYSEVPEKKLKDSNIKLAFLFDHKINYDLFHPMRISRLIVNDSTPIWKFKFILSGKHSKILPVIKLVSRFIKK